MAMTIRELEDGDVARVTALWRDVDLVRPWNDPDGDFLGALAGPTSAVLGAEIDGELVGTAMVGFDGHRGWLYYVASAPEARGSGVGRQMVQAAEAWLRARGVVKAQLLVRETNTQVVSFYERLGFEVTPRVVMAKWLGEQQQAVAGETRQSGGILAALKRSPLGDADLDLTRPREAGRGVDL